MIMDNIEIIILSSIVVTLFVTFIIVTYRELANAERNPTPSEESGPRADMIKFLGRLFDEESFKKKTTRQKVDAYNAVKINSIKNTLSDMESDGVYFPSEVIKELEKKRQELICGYSGLPSVMAYNNETGLPVQNSNGTSDEDDFDIKQYLHDHPEILSQEKFDDKFKR